MEINYGSIKDERVKEEGAKSFSRLWKKVFGNSAPSKRDIGNFLVGLGVISPNQTDDAIETLRNESARYSRFFLWERRFQLVEAAPNHYRLNRWTTASGNSYW